MEARSLRRAAACPLTRPATRPRARAATALLALLAFAAPARASVAREAGALLARPALVAPAEGERMVESAVRFAFETPRRGARPVLVLSRRAFDPAGWTAIPDDPELIVREVEGPLLSLADAGVGVDSETRLWWAVGVRDRETEALRMSAARSFVALRKFANRVAPSPYLPPARLGTLDPGDVIGARAALSGAAPQGGAPPRIRLAAGYDWAPAAGEPAVPPELSSARVAAEESGPHALRSYLVQFEAPPGAPELAAIASAGGAVIAYIPDQTYLVRMSEAARAKLSASRRPAWIGDYQPAYKLSPALDRGGPGEIACVALLFPDADLGRARAGLASIGAALVDDSDNGINKLIRFRAAGASLAAIAALPAVEWVEPVPRMECLNDNAQWVVQTNLNGNRRVWTMGIRGQGQVVMTSDSGILTAHNQFFDSAHAINDFGDYPDHRKIIAYKKGSNSSLVTFGDHSTASWHGTHTAGTLCGDDAPNSTSARDGMAKEAKIYFMDIGGSTLGISLDIFPDLNDLLLPPYAGNAGGAARVSSHSWGGGPTQAYTLYSMQADQFVWNHPDFYVAFATGNSGPGVGTVGTPATAKSPAGAGGTQNGIFAGSIYSGTSRGPTADGRRKPTFCSPGQGVTSSVGPSSGNYASYTGTSMATPSGTGAVVLMRQYLTDGWYPTGAPVPANGFTPSAALLKAMAINSAENGVSGFTAPDNNVGWGRINADNVLYFAGDAKKLLLVDNPAGLANAQYLEYQINVVDGSAPLEVTLCWSDYPGSPAAAVQLVNNLDLTVSKGATVYKGNVYSGGVSTTGGSYDNLNVEENVLVPAPATGLWTVRVAAPAAPIGPQPFALVVTGGVGNGAGALALDRAEYGSGSTMEIEVIDTNAGPSVEVSVTSSTEGAAETVTIAGANGVYHGTLALSPLPSQIDDGTLTVSSGDLLTATYADASPSATLTATAQVNFDTPTITDVHATSLGGAGTLVTWTTDRNATSRVHYGLTPALELGQADSAGAVLGHQVLIGGLTPGMTYYYDVESASLSGSEARDSLGGAHHRFTAEGSADVLLLLNDPSFERTAAWTSALAAKGYDYDIWSGTIAERAPLGDRSSGLRSYKAVLWQAGFYDYPAFSDAQRETITAYLEGGGRLATIGHDIGWGLADPASPSYSAARAAWLQSTLHAQYRADPPTWSGEFGIAADPISGAYTGGVAYQPLGSGQAGDEIAVTGSGGAGTGVWRNNDSSPDTTAFRWEDAAPSGNPATAFWGGTRSRLVGMFFEFTALQPPFQSPSAIRNDILDKTIVWLLGRPGPTTALTFPNGGESLTGSSASVSWTETVGPGRSVAQRTLEYSADGGDSWTLITNAAGPSPYLWDLTSVPNTPDARVRVRIVDDGAPALSATDASNAGFAVNRAGGDADGPVVVAGSIECSPNPIVRANPATLVARVSDQLTGGGTVAAAEWSYGDVPGTTALGGALGGAFGATTVDVSAAIATDDFFTGMRKLWVRAQDAAGNWGPWSALSLRVNGTDPVGVPESPAISFLAQNAPNPFAARTVIRFGLARPGEAALDVFDTRGRRVRRLVRGALPAGAHVATWDGADDAGASVPPGVYCCRLVTPGARLERRLVRVE